MLFSLAVLEFTIFLNVASCFFLKNLKTPFLEKS